MRWANGRQAFQTPVCHVCRPRLRSPGSSSDPGRAAGERRPPPDSVPAGSRRPGAATGRGQPCEVPEAPSHLVSLGLAGAAGWGWGAPDGSSLPTHPLPACAPVPDLSVFLGHIFLTCCYRPPLRSHSSCSFCTPSGSSLVPRAPGAGTRTLEHLLSSDRRVFGFYCLSVPKWENPDTAPL